MYIQTIDDQIELAKRILRRRGWIVFNAEVTGGPKSRGLYRVDGQLWARDQLLEAAAK